MRFVKTAALAVLLALGSAAIAEERAREIKAEKVEQLALEELDRKRAELLQQLTALSAEGALVISEIAARHKLGPEERLEGYDATRGVFRVVTVPRAITEPSSATIAALRSR